MAGLGSEILGERNKVGRKGCAEGGEAVLKTNEAGEWEFTSSAVRRRRCYSSEPLSFGTLVTDATILKGYSGSDAGHSYISVGLKFVLWNVPEHVCYPFPHDSSNIWNQIPSNTSLF